MTRIALCTALALLASTWTRASAAPRYIGILAAPGEPSLFTKVTADQWRQAFEQSDLVKSGGFSVSMLRTAAALTDALTTHTADYFAIVNPNGEVFLCGGKDDALAMNARIREYLRRGGIWWETGGWPFCRGAYLQQNGAWNETFIGAAGLDGLRIDGWQWKDHAPTVQLSVTDAGRVWLGQETADAISRLKGAVQRESKPEQAAVVLAHAGDVPYLAGYRVGFGWLFRPEGMNPDAAVILPAAIHVCEHLHAMEAEIAKVAPGSIGARAHRPILIGVVSPKPDWGVWTAPAYEYVRDALAETALCRAARVIVEPLQTPAELTRALTEKAPDYLAIINPQGEVFLADSDADVKPMLARIKAYVEQGGLWWETGGVPFWYPREPKREGGRIVGWTVGNYGAAGFATFGLHSEITPDGPPLPVKITAAGRELVGPAAEAMEKEVGWANRPPDPSPGDTVLATVGGRPYAVATRVGKGLLFHMGGMPVSPAVMVPLIAGSCTYLWGHVLPGPDKTPTPALVPGEKPAPAVAIKAIPNLEYAKVDGKSMMLDLYLPAKFTGRLPVIVAVHGGGWMAGTRKDMTGPDLVRHGYAVAAVEYRLSQQAKWPAQMYDLKGAIRWLRAHADQYGLDPAHFGAWGHSAGGHLVAMLGVTAGVKNLEGDEGGNLDQSSAVQAVSDWAGPTDFLTWPGQEGAQSGPSLLLGFPVGKNREKAARACPIMYVSKNSPPFLIVHGACDDLVPPAQARELYDALTKAGVPATLMIRPWTDHGIADPTVTAAQDAFFDKWLKPHN